MRSFWLLIPILSLVACTMTQEITFNKNWSGKVATTIDFTAMSGLTGSDDSLKLFDETENSDKLNKLKELDGISNVKVSENTKDVYQIQYEFKSIKALNESCRLIYDTPESPSTTDFVTLKGKSELEVNIPVIPKAEGEEGESAEGEEDMEAMGELFIYKVKLNFKRKMKSYVSTCDSVVKNGNSLEITTNIGQLSQKDKRFVTTIKF